MKVLVFTNMYPFPDIPSYGSFVKDEVEALRRAGCEVDVLFINGARNKLNYLRSPFQFFSHLMRKRYDIVHVHHSFCGCIAILQKRVPVVWTFHEGEILRDSGIVRSDSPFKRLAYSRRFKRMVAGRVDVLIVVSEHLKAPLGRENALTLPSGIDTELFYPMERAEARYKLGLDRGGYCILFPSTPARVEKRFDLARKSVDLARKLVGEIEILNLENIPHERVPLYINAANAMLMTSSFEASPVTVREALACNVPVVSTDVGDAGKVLEGVEGCYIVEPQPDEIASALAECLRNYPRIAGREKVMAYSLPNTAGKLIEIYRKAAESGRG